MKVAVKHRVRATPPALVRDAEIHDEVDRRARGVHKESSQLDISTPLTPAAGHLRCLDLGDCAEEVRKLLCSPIMCLLSARVSRAGANMITEGVKYELRAPTGRGRQCGDRRNLCTHSKGKEYLPQTGGPGRSHVKTEVLCAV